MHFDIAKMQNMKILDVLAFQNIFFFFLNGKKSTLERNFSKVITPINEPQKIYNHRGSQRLRHHKETGYKQQKAKVKGQKPKASYK